LVAAAAAAAVAQMFSRCPIMKMGSKIRRRTVTTAALHNLLVPIMSRMCSMCLL
jgi:hypothetical protein